MLELSRTVEIISEDYVASGDTLKAAQWASAILAADKGIANEIRELPDWRGHAIEWEGKAAIFWR